VQATDIKFELLNTQAVTQCSIDNVSIKEIIEVADFYIPPTRWLSILDPVLNSYYKIVKPVVFTGDFEIELELITSSFEGHLICGTSEIAQDYIFVRSETAEIGLSIFGAAFNGTIVVADGDLHKIKITKVGTTLSLFVDDVPDGTGTTTASSASFGLIGVWSNGSLYFDGILANSKFTDLSGLEPVTTTFALDNSTATNNYILNAEKVVNGDFATDSDWDKSNFWTISNGVASMPTTSNFSPLQQDLGLQGEKTYVIKFNVIAITGNIKVLIWNGSNSVEPFINISTVGEKTIIVTPVAGHSYIAFSRNTINSSCTIDNVSVKEITNYEQAQQLQDIEYSAENVFGSELVINGNFVSYSNWTVTATGTESATIANNILTLDRPSDGTDPKITNTGSVIAGKTYLVEFKVLSATNLSNNVAVVFGTQITYLTTQAQNLSPFGLKRFYITANQNGLISLLHGGSGPSTITLSEFTVKEITNAVKYKNIPESNHKEYSKPVIDGEWVEL